MRDKKVTEGDAGNFASTTVTVTVRGQSAVFDVSLPVGQGRLGTRRN
ncbi:hypothetical protein [Streptomyces sp. NPDC051452]